jgi:hypothetical protein
VRELSMFKCIFKNYDELLEKINQSFNKLISDEAKEELNRQSEEDIELEADLALLKETKDFHTKIDIVKKIVFILLHREARVTSSKYVKSAWEFLKEGINEDNLYKALDYLNRVPLLKLSDKDRESYHIFRALIFEALEEYSKASKEYKVAIKDKVSERALRGYRSFIERYQELFKDDNNRLNISLLYTLHDTLPLEELPKAAKTLENLAKYYARSPKSRHLAKKYFKESLNIYEKLFISDKDKYICEYIRVILEGIEDLMISDVLLKRVIKFLRNDPDICEEQRDYLLDKIKELQEKSYINVKLAETV